MRRISSYLSALFLLAAGVAFAQVLSPPEIPDAQLRDLQQKHFADLKRVATEVSSHPFPYRFYFSRTLDLTEEQQKRVDQRSIRFDKFRDQTVLEITGNYYASYSAELMQKEQRAHQTLQDVIVPMLQAAIPALEGEDQFQSFAIEISQHVRKKVLGVTNENAENVAFVLPVRAAKRLIAATAPDEQDAALREGELFVNRQPLNGWGPDNGELIAKKTAPPPNPILKQAQAPAPLPMLAKPQPEPAVAELTALQTSHQTDLDALVHSIDNQAHFVSYAPPAFITFRKGVYLQLSIKTTLREAVAGSQYEMAALAFDEHIAHLIRPVLTALKGKTDFAGIDFSSSVRLAGTAEGEGTAIEFIFPTEGLTFYQDYDLTGQQLIDKSFLLINGERVGLNLQSAEAGPIAKR